MVKNRPIWYEWTIGHGSSGAGKQKTVHCGNSFLSRLRATCFSCCAQGEMPAFESARLTPLLVASSYRTEPILSGLPEIRTVDDFTIDGDEMNYPIYADDAHARVPLHGFRHQATLAPHCDDPGLLGAHITTPPFVLRAQA